MVIKNASFLFVGNLIFRFISLIVAIHLARYLGVGNFGKYTFIFVYLGFFSILTDLGLNTILVREMSRDQKSMPKMLGNSYIMKIILSAITMLISITLAIGIYSQETVIYICIASFTLLFEAIITLYQTISQTALKMEYQIVAKLASKIVFAVSIFYIIAMQGNLYQAIVALTCSEIVEVLLNYIYSRKITKADFVIDLKLWKKLLSFSLPIAIFGVFQIIYSRVDVLMLSMMKDDTAIGLYSAAYNISEPLILIPYAIVAPLFPVMSKSYLNSVENLETCCEKGLKYTSITMLPVAIGITLIADKIILLVYGQSYSGSILALKILIWSLLLTSISYFLTLLLIAMNKEKLTTLTISICVIINVVLNFLLISPYSYIGASVATVLSALILVLIDFYLLFRSDITIPISETNMKPLVASIIMGIYVYYINKFANVNIVIIIISATIVYIIGLVAVKTFPKEEIIFIKNIFKDRVL